MSLRLVAELERLTSCLLVVPSAEVCGDSFGIGGKTAEASDLELLADDAFSGWSGLGAWCDSVLLFSGPAFFDIVVLSRKCYVVNHVVNRSWHCAADSTFTFHHNVMMRQHSAQS